MQTHRLLILLFILCLTAIAPSFADEESERRQIQQWCGQLGNESFHVRTRAESLLIQSGIQAYYELQRVRQSSDVEAVRRAEYILSQIEQTLLDSENRAVAVWLNFYMMAANPALKAAFIRVLADPGSDLNKGEGLQTLCRFVRFEENETLRLEAAKCLIASPPLTPSLRQHWYRYIRDNIQETGVDSVIAALAQFAKLWCDLDEAESKNTPELQDRVRQIGTETLQLLDNSELNIQAGSRIDLLLHYAVIELYDAAGLTEDRDKTLEKVLAVQQEPIRSSEPIEPIMSVVDDHLLMSAHYYAAWYLKQRYRLHWAAAHYQKVIETGDIFLRMKSSEEAAEIAIYLADEASAIAFFDKHLEILNSPEYKKTRSDSPQRAANAQKRKAYCLAEQAAAAEDWESVKKHITEGWAVSGAPDTIADTDLVIVAYRLCQEKPELADTSFKEKMNQSLQQIWQAIENDYHRSSPDLRVPAMILMCNGAAWILANTGGDYAAALTFAEIAQKAEPEDAGILDTLAHVYFLGGKVDEAIRVQEQVVRSAPEAVVFRRTLERFQQARSTMDAMPN